MGRKVTSKGMCAVFLKVHHSVHGVLQYTLYVCGCTYNMRDNTSVLKYNTLGNLDYL